MKSFKHLMLLFVLLTAGQTAFSQSLAGNAFRFPNGTKEWSDPLDKNLQSVKMDKKGIAPVPLVFRIKLQKRVTMGKWYYVEVTNKSEQYTIQFTMQASGVNQDKYSIKLKPGETKVYEKFNWHLNSFGDKLRPDEEPESWAFVFEGIGVK
ncbi:MAG TPA: hypothetical protein P5050_00285 [Bacteroidia bacterium]|nr:hypothetical protein [Bacteroidia bacterium]HRS57637.1 hypothetical protein [Bacteroidia bacterium]HRU68924.1 hypothetical protein [Bacteroidia bacterium]